MIARRNTTDCPFRSPRGLLETSFGASVPILRFSRPREISRRTRRPFTKRSEGVTPLKSRVKGLNLSARTRHARVSLHLDVNATPSRDSSVIKQRRKVTDTPELDRKLNYRATTDGGTGDREWNLLFSATECASAFFLLSCECKCRTIIVELIFKYITGLPRGISRFTFVRDKNVSSN